MSGGEGEGGTDSTERVVRQVGDLRLEIDRRLCVGFADCIDAAPLAFALDDDEIAIFVNPDAVSRESLLRACAACPVDAITVTGADGQDLVP